MPKQDYIMRLLEQLQGTLPYILDMVKSGNYVEAHAMIDQVCRELIGVSSTGLVRLKDEDILREIQADATIAWEDKAFYLATLLKEDAEIYWKEDKVEESVARYHTAVLLFIHIALNDKERADEYSQTITEIATILHDYELPAPTYSALMTFYETIGDFAEAEDFLYEWLDVEPLDDTLNFVEVGEAFYRRLLQKTDAELEAGNLPREEVEAALQELLE